MAHILLVDDDMPYRSALSQLLSDAGHAVVEAEDGLVAQNCLNTPNNFDLTISDIRMPKCDGVQFLRWSKSKSRMPVILITGFSEILETAEASRIGADGFLAKPFKFDEIQSLISEVLRGPKNDMIELTEIDHQYCKVPVESFVTGSNINYNIFHRMSETKYLKIANRGEDILNSRIEFYKSQGMRNLYLAKDDFTKYVGFTLDLAKKMGKNSQISTERKRDFLRYTGELILEQIFIDPVDAEEFESAKDFTQTTLEVIQEQDDVFSLLYSLNTHADFLYAHSLGVSLYSVILARHLKWHWTPKLFKISLAGLLHDIGLKEIPKAIVEKSRASLTQEERTLFESHSARGMELLNSIRGIPEDVILVSYQHHENNTGTGYPQHLYRSKIHPFARLVAIADIFCDYTIHKPGYERLSAGDAIKLMKSREAALEPDYFLALKQVFKFSATDEEQ